MNRSKPQYTWQNELNDVLSRLMNDAECTPEEREYVLSSAAAALMETYQHGYWDGSNNLGSKVRESDLVERDTSRDWSFTPTAGELGIANPPQLSPEDYPEDSVDTDNWESEGGNGQHR